MDAASLYFSRLLLEKIQAKQAEMMKRLMQGVATDYADYKDRAGYLRALSEVVTWMEDITLADQKRENRP